MYIYVICDGGKRLKNETRAARPSRATKLYEHYNPGLSVILIS